MDWIHCNSCFIQPGEMKGKSYNLTSCGHMYCNSCLKPGSTDPCKVCKSQFTTVPLSSEMRPDVQEFFTGVDEMMNRVLKILAFQNGHRLRLIAFNRAVGGKYKNAKEEIKKLNEIILAFQRKLKDVEKENQMLKRKLSRPPSDSGSAQSTANFFMTPRTQPSKKFLATPSPPYPGPFSKNSSQNSHPNSSQGSWMTPNRLTLPHHHSPFSEVISPASQGEPSPETHEKAYTSRRTPGTPSMKTFATPPYRSRPYFSSQSNTPNTPSTPGTPGTPDLPDRHFPAMPTSATMKGTPQTSAPTSPFGLLSLNSQRSARESKY